MSPSATDRRLRAPHVRWMVALPILLAVLASVSAGVASARRTPMAATPADGTTDAGRDLFLSSCATCHGRDGRGTKTRGPSIVDEGAAAADFVLRTGRMPLHNPDDQARRSPPRFSDEQIVQLVSFVASLGDGPAIPEVSADRGDVSVGGELFRQNCSSCHQAIGQGGSVGGGHDAPSLQQSTSVQVGQAMLVGPDVMPVFSNFDDQQVDDIAAYVRTIQRPDDRGGLGIGHIGPVAEGYAVWFLGLVPLVLLARWIGTRNGS